MTPEEEKAVLLVEMRLAGVPHQVVNYCRKYFGKTRPSGRVLKTETMRYLIRQREAGEDFSDWVDNYGHHFEDADNLPADDSWSRRPG